MKYINYQSSFKAENLYRQWFMRNIKFILKKLPTEQIRNLQALMASLWNCNKYLRMQQYRLTQVLYKLKKRVNSSHFMMPELPWYWIKTKIQFKKLYFNISPDYKCKNSFKNSRQNPTTTKNICSWFSLFMNFEFTIFLID